MSQHIFCCCCCRGNFKHCSLTVKSVIHPLVDLPSVLVLKTNNLSLDWVYYCLDSGRKTGRLKKIRPLAAPVLIFSLHYLHKCCEPCALSGNHPAVTLWHTRTWKIEGKDGKNGKRGWVCLNECVERKGKKEKKKGRIGDVIFVQTNLQNSVDTTMQTSKPTSSFTQICLKHFNLKKKKRQNWSTMLRLQRKIKEQSCLSCVRNESKKKKSKASGLWHDSSVFMSIIFLSVCVVLTHRTEHTES